MIVSRNLLLMVRVEKFVYHILKRGPIIFYSFRLRYVSIIYEILQDMFEHEILIHGII